MAIVPYCPPGAQPVVDTRKWTRNPNMPGPLYDDLTAAEYNKRLEYFTQKPLEIEALNYEQAGPKPYPASAFVVVCFSSYAVRDQVVITSTKNPLAQTTRPEAPTHQGPFFRLEDTFIVPRKRGYHKSTPIYKQISEQERATKYANSCLFQDPDTGTFYINGGTKQENGCYPYGNVYYRFAANGILYNHCGCIGYYMREPKPGAQTTSFTQINNGF